jgi:competence protein ComEC
VTAATHADLGHVNAGPVDLRLAVPAATAWLAAAVGCGWPVHRSGTAVALALAAAVLATARGRLAVAAAAAGLVLGGSAAALHVAALHSGPVAAMARSGHAHSEVVLTLVRDPLGRVGRNGQPFVLADATVDVLGRTPTRAPVLIIAHGPGWQTLLPGQRVKVKARLTPPRTGDDIAAVLLPMGRPALIGQPPWWQRAAGAVRARLRSACTSLPADERGLVPGLVVGDVSAMPASLTNAFRVSGLTHLNAVSGENCAIVLATVGAILRRTPLRRGARIAVSAVSLAAFVVLARPSPSVLRAATMGGIALVAVSLGRRSQPLPLLSGAVLLLVLLNPFLARSVGFALSVAATAAIVLIAPTWTSRLSRWMPRPIAVAVAVPAAAQLACTPLLVAVFGQATPWAIPANLLAAPAVAPATIAGIVTAAVAVASPTIAAVLAWVAALPAGWLALVARAMAALPGASARWPTGFAGLSLLGAVLLAVVALSQVVVRRRRGALLRDMLAAWPL